MLLEFFSKKDLSVFTVIQSCLTTIPKGFASSLLLSVCILIAENCDPGSTQKISSFVAQKGTMFTLGSGSNLEYLEYGVSRSGKKLVNVSALISYLDIPL